MILRMSAVAPLLLFSESLVYFPRVSSGKSRKEGREGREGEEWVGAERERGESGPHRDRAAAGGLQGQG